MKNFNFTLGLIFALALAVLGYLNAADPMKGWIFGILIISFGLAIGIGIGSIRSRFVEEEGLVLSFVVGVLYLAVVMTPVLFLKGWVAVGASLVLVIIWKLTYDSYNKE